MKRSLIQALAVLGIVARVAFAQSGSRAVFVCNNGNLEGSVTAFTVNPDGTLTFVNRVITGTRTSLSDPCAGCNAYEISITPNGKYLATGHPAGDLDGITILSVAPSAAISQVFQLPLPAGLGTPLDVVWINNNLLAVTRTDTSPDQIVVYLFNPQTPSLTEFHAFDTGTNGLGYLAMHPSGRFLYANDSSSARLVRAYQVAIAGFLSPIDTEATGAPFPLELAITADGKRMYAAGGISDGGHRVIGMNIAADGTLSIMPDSPFTSPGNSPSNVCASGDGRYLIVGHGTDATARSFTIDELTGTLAPTGSTFDVGLQGTLGDVRTMGNRLYITDNSTATNGIQGIYAFTIEPDGTLTQDGPIATTGGISPRSIATWVPGDLNGDGVVNGLDLAMLLAAWGRCPPPPPGPGGAFLCPADLDGNGLVDGLDLAFLLGGWG